MRKATKKRKASKKGREAFNNLFVAVVERLLADLPKKEIEERITKLEKGIYGRSN